MGGMQGNMAGSRHMIGRCVFAATSLLLGLCFFAALFSARQASAAGTVLPAVSVVTDGVDAPVEMMRFDLSADSTETAHLSCHPPVFRTASIFAATLSSRLATTGAISRAPPQ
jgi:hypothetical protein